MQKYSRVRCIGLNKVTSPAFRRDKTPLRIHTSTRKSYLIEKIEQLKGLIKYCITESSFDNSGRILNIFMVPEFYFMDPISAYEMDDIPFILEYMQTFFSSPQLNHCLFVLGSIVATHQESIEQTCVYNICPVVLAGETFTIGRSTTFIRKEFISGVDQDLIAGQNFEMPYWKDTDVSGERVEEYHPAISPYSSRRTPTIIPPDRSKGEVEPTFIIDPADLTVKRKKDDLYSGKGYFSFPSICDKHGNRILFALEIGIDHIVGKLRKSPPPVDFSYSSHIHLVLSCGIRAGHRLSPFTMQNIVCGHNGIAFYVDGWSSHSRDTRCEVYINRGTNEKVDLHFHRMNYCLPKIGGNEIDLFIFNTDLHHPESKK